MSDRQGIFMCHAGIRIRGHREVRVVHHGFFRVDFEHGPRWRIPVPHVRSIRRLSPRFIIPFPAFYPRSEQQKVEEQGREKTADRPSLYSDGSGAGNPAPGENRLGVEPEPGVGGDDDQAVPGPVSHRSPPVVASPDQKIGDGILAGCVPVVGRGMANERITGRQHRHEGDEGNRDAERTDYQRGAVYDLTPGSVSVWTTDSRHDELPIEATHGTIYRFSPERQSRQVSHHHVMRLPDPVSSGLFA